MLGVDIAIVIARPNLQLWFATDSIHQSGIILVSI